MMLKKKNRLLFLVFLPLSVLGQNFHSVAQLDSVKESGFYVIPIDPELSSYLKTDLSDIRIKDNKDTWVPHIIHYPLSNKVNDIVNEDLPILTNSSKIHVTTIVCNNVSKHVLSNLVLLTKNTASNRFSSISGSDDQLHWFSVVDSFLLSKPIAAGGDKQAFHISIPGINYKYVRFIINDYNKDPLNILEVYTEADGKNKTEEKYITNPNPSFIQEDSTGYSLIKIRNTAPWHINEILFSISFPKYFERHAKLFTHYSGSIKDQLSQDAFSDFWISSNNNMPIEIPLIKADSTYILVENDDNPPLKIDSISSSQLYKEIVAYLERGKHYSLVFNDSKAIAPQYDLKQFSPNISYPLPQLNHGKIEAHEIKTTAITSGPNTRKWIWPVIVVVILLLGYLAWSLTNDMRQKEN